MKRWLALNRWRLLITLGCVVILRVALAIIPIALGAQRFDPIRLTAETVCSMAICALAVATIIAFVQYGRIFNPRIPTE